MLSLLWACSLFAARYAEARPDSTYQAPGCGQTRLVLLRFLDGKPVTGVKVVLGAASPAMGGPGFPAKRRSGEPSAAEGSEGGDGGQGAVMPTQSAPGLACNPIVTGTLTVRTDGKGLAQFDHLGEGTWLLWFEGEVTYGDRSAPVVPASIQGRFPEGRTREGGGFMERIDALNEEGGPNPALVQPSAGATTSRYVLTFSAKYGGWLPGLDLAGGDDVPPLPLAEVATVVAVPIATPVVAPVGTPTEDSPGRNAQEPAFDQSNVAPPPPQDSAPSQLGQRAEERTFSAWWTAVLGLTLAGVVAVLWGKRLSNGARRVRK